MTRRKLRRYVGALPNATLFKPQDGPAQECDEVTLELDEFEAVRLVDLEGLYQDAAAVQMGVSRPTLGRILQAAHQKIADALVHGKTLAICNQSAFAKTSSNSGLGCCKGRRGRPRKCVALPLCPDTALPHHNPPELKNGKEPLMIIVSAKGTEWDSPLDQRFGRTPYLLLIDPKTNEITKVIDNHERAEAASGAGVQTAQITLDSKADVLITGRLGPKADDILRASDIKIVISGPCTVREAVDQYLNS